MTIVASQLTEISLKTAAAPKTPTPSPLPAVTEKPTVPATPAITQLPAQKAVDFTGHQVFVAYLDNEVLQVSITVPNGISGDYLATFDEKPYTCFTYTSKSLDRLICNGAILRSELSYPFRVFIKGSETPIFERYVTVPVPPT